MSKSKNFCTPLEVFFCVFLFFLVFNTTFSHSSICENEEQLINYRYIGACGYASAQDFELTKDTYITRVRVWFYPPAGSDNFVLYDASGNIVTSDKTVGSCYAGWCERFLQVNRVLKAGRYIVRGPNANICSDPSGKTTLVVYGCSNISPAKLLDRLAVCDLNYDKRMDIVYRDTKGNIRYTLDLKTWKSIPGSLEKHLVCGDVNGDGNIDIVGINSQNEIYFTSDYGLEWHKIPGSLVKFWIADFDGDSKHDFLGLNEQNQIYIAYDLPNYVQIPGLLRDIVVGDFNTSRDGLEFVGINPQNRIFYTSNMEDFIQIPGELNFIVSGDINGDGRSDLVGLNSLNQIYFTVDLRTWQNIPGTLSFIALGDLNGDKRHDIVGINERKQIYYRLSGTNDWVNIPGELNDLKLGDLDGDGKDEVIGIGGDGNVYYYGLASRTWNIVGLGQAEPPRIFTVSPTGGQIKVDDIEINFPAGTFNNNTQVVVTPFSSYNSDLPSAVMISKAYQVQLDGLTSRELEIKLPVKTQDDVFLVLESDDFMMTTSGRGRGLRLLDVERIGDRLVAKIPQSLKQKSGMVAYSSNVSYQDNIKTNSSFTVYFITGYKKKTSEHFSIRYPAVKCENASDRFLQYAEEAYRKIVYELGFDPSGIYMPTLRMPIDVVKMRNYGEMSYHSWTLGILDTFWLSLSINESLCTHPDGDRIAKATIGHEFFHAIQFSYEPYHALIEIFTSRGKCLFEATSTWFEGEMLGQPYYLEDPGKTEAVSFAPKGLGYGCRTAPQSYGYGMSTFLRYLTDKYGKEIVLPIWINVNRSWQNSAPVDYMKGANIKVGDAWHDFAKNFMTGNTAFNVLPSHERVYKLGDKPLKITQELYQLSAKKVLIDLRQAFAKTSKLTCNIKFNGESQNYAYIYNRTQQLLSLDKYISERTLTIDKNMNINYLTLILINDKDTTSSIFRRYEDKESVSLELRCGPYISSISPSTGKPGDKVVITGEGFGNAYDKRELYFGSISVTDVTWSPDGRSAEFKVPTNAQAGDYPVKVVVNGMPSNEVVFKILAYCGTTQQAGGNIPSTRTIELGKTSGTFKFEYQTYDVPDQIQIYYENRVLFDSGCVGTQGFKSTFITYNGRSSQITVKVIPNCASTPNTEWIYIVHCP